MQLKLYKNQLKIGRVQPKINYIIMSERRKNMNLSDNLKKIRKEQNLSQEDLAESLGVSRQSVSKWESGQAYPEMDKVLQICKMFDVSIDDLLNQDRILSYQVKGESLDDDVLNNLDVLVNLGLVSKLNKKYYAKLW